MDLSPVVYSLDLKITAMHALGCRRHGEIARKYQLSSHLLVRWWSEWRAKGDLAFPGIGRRGAGLLTAEFAPIVGFLIAVKQISNSNPGAQTF